MNDSIPQVQAGVVWQEIAWPDAIDPPAPAEAHVWAADVAAIYPATLVELSNVLSDDERGRASKFVHEKHRIEYVFAHAVLRMLMSRYLRCRPSDVVLMRGPNGKPELSYDIGLSFNLAHSNGAVVIATAAGYDIGVDVEQMQPIVDADNLVRRYFSSREAAGFDALPEFERDSAFYRLWTRKEAYLKALGRGLSQPLDSFEVTYGRGEPYRVIHAEPGDWSFFHLAPQPGLVGALAVRAKVTRLIGGILGCLGESAGS